MSTFTLAISCLTTSNLPWFMDLTFQVPMQYCSLQHRTLLLSPVKSTTGYCFCFGSIHSFFLELFLHWSPVAYWAPTDLGSSSFSILSFCLFILFKGFSRQEYWSGIITNSQTILKSANKEPSSVRVHMRAHTNQRKCKAKNEKCKQWLTIKTLLLKTDSSFLVMEGHNGFFSSVVFVVL